MTETLDRIIGRYRLLEEIGQGGMSVVYRAVEIDTGRIVAIKVLSPYVAQDPQFKARFDREVSLLKQLDHPNIVPILNYGDEQQNTYIVMPYYGGGTMQSLIEDDGMELRQAGEILADVAAGLDHAHRQGIVHRDIKPSNIIIDDEGTALISDFGFAHVSNTSHSLTGSVLIGTPAFMSPEQCAGHEVDPRSDQYSLGAVLYQACTGQLPYEGETPMAVVIKHISDPLPRPRYANPLLPDVVEAVIQRAMTKDPGLRFGSAIELSEAFEHALDESLDPESGLAKSEYIGPTPVTQVVVARPTPVWGPRRTLAAIAILLMVAFPAAAVSFSGGIPGGVQASNNTATPSVSLLATINALSTANSERLEGSQQPGAVETAVAATIQAMGLFDTPTATLEGTRPTPTPTGGGSSGSGGGGSGPPPPPLGPPPPSATPGGPTNTPSSLTGTPGGPTNTPGGPTGTPVPPSSTPVPPTSTPLPPTNTPVLPPPRTDPGKCKGPNHPQFPCTPTPEP